MGKRWAFLLYGIGISGGANVVFEHALFAFSKGVEITFVTLVEKGYKEAQWHKGTENFRFLTLEKASKEKFDVAIATEWRSAYDIYCISAEKYVYFVQSIESRFFFNSKNVLKFFAESTYTMPFTYVTETEWIKDYLSSYYSQNALVIQNGINKNLFSIEGKSIEKRPDNHIRILVEGSVFNWLKNVPRTIELCHEAGVEDIWLVTPDDIKTFPGVSKVFSKIAYEKMPEIYRSCDVLVKLSLVEGMFGPPLEMFHCGGTAIAYDIEGANEYMVDNFNSLIIEKGDENSVVKAIKLLKEDINLVSNLKQNAVVTASEWMNWAHSSKMFYEFIETTDSISEHNRIELMKRGKEGSDGYRYFEELFGVEQDSKRITKLIEYYKKNGGQIYLYGAGKMCIASILALSKYDIPIEGIIVSSKDNNPKTVMGHLVYEIQEITNTEKKIVYITSSRYYDEMSNELVKKGINAIL